MTLAPRLREPSLRVLLAGFGELGLALLRELVRFEHIHLRLFDPTVVQDLSAAGVDRALISAMQDVDIVVSCLDQPSELTGRFAALCHGKGVALVVAQQTDVGGLIDPVLAGDRSRDPLGCPRCAELYRAARDRFAAAMSPDLEQKSPRPVPWQFSHTAADIQALAQLTVISLRNALEQRAGQRPPGGRVTLVDFARRRVASQQVPKHYACELCYPRTATESGALKARLASGALPVDLAVLHERLLPLAGEDYAIFEPMPRMPPQDRQAIFRRFRERGVEPLHNRLANAHRAVSARRAIAGGKASTQYSEYLDLDDPRKAEAIAMIEGLERLFTLEYCAPERIVHDSWEALATSVLDPRRFPLYAEEQYGEADFPLRRFNPKAVIPWIEGVTLADDRPVLVPLDFVRSTTGPSLYHATSNGAACHSSLAHAIVNGIYETVERDAFMIAWLNRLSLPGIAMTASDPDPDGLRDTFEKLDFELAFVDITTDLDIPVVLGVLRDRRNPDFLLTNMVASLDPGRALGKLTRELAQFAYSYLRDPGHLQSERTADPDPSHVRTFSDHLAFYQSREKNRHADFLTIAPRIRRFGEGPYCADTGEIHIELETLGERLSRRGYEIIVVDCTVPMLAQLGLHVVKVLIPGLQPLNAGHRRRVLGGRRLYRAPVDMGLREREYSIRELNSWPHPFW